MTQKVQTQSPEVTALAQGWPIAEALLGGTAAMRAAGKVFLPMETQEDHRDYTRRLATATLFPAFVRTLGVMAGKPFCKQVTLGDDVPAKIKGWCDNIDQQGNSLHTFAASVMDEVLGFGLAGVLVDHPRVEGARTLADERAIGARPYMVIVRHNQILGWKSERVNGAVVLTQLRIAETKEVPDGEFGLKHEQRVRVLTPGAWAVYMPSAKADDDWVIEDEGRTTLAVIPFAPFYGKKRGFMDGVSPLLDLAHLNVKHWQQQSDQDDSARFARKRLLVFTGMDDQDKIVAAANYAVQLPQGATATVVQGSAESVTVGRSELNALEDQMIQTGAELLVSKPGQRSATEANNDAEANKSDLQRITEAFEDSLDLALQYCAMWAKLPEGGHCALYKDFGASTLTDASAQLVLSLQQGGLISKETAIREQQRRGMLAADIVPEDELAAVEEEGPALGTIGDE